MKKSTLTALSVLFLFGLASCDTKETKLKTSISPQKSEFVMNKKSRIRKEKENKTYELSFTPKASFEPKPNQ